MQYFSVSFDFLFFLICFVLTVIILTSICAFCPAYCDICEIGGYCTMLLLRLKAGRLKMNILHPRNFSYLKRLFIFKIFLMIFQQWQNVKNNFMKTKEILPYQFSSLKWVRKLNNDVGSLMFSLEYYFSNRKDS